MKNKILYAIIFLFVPVALLVTIIVRKDPAYHGKSTADWVQEMRTNQEVALNALQHVGAGALPTLKDGLKSSSITERCRAALALGKLGAPAKDAVPDLIQTIDDRNLGVQCEVMMALTRIGVTNEDLVPKLMAKLSNKETGPYAATLLNSIEQERKANNLPPLPEAGYNYGMACLKSPTPSMRLNGAIQLAGIAQQDQRAETALQSLLNDQNGWVRDGVGKLMTNPDALANFHLVTD